MLHLDRLQLPSMLVNLYLRKIVEPTGVEQLRLPKLHAENSPRTNTLAYFVTLKMFYQADPRK
jgi:hypothetical protein